MLADGASEVALTTPICGRWAGEMRAVGWKRAPGVKCTVDFEVKKVWNSLLVIFVLIICLNDNTLDILE